MSVKVSKRRWLRGVGAIHAGELFTHTRAFTKIPQQQSVNFRQLKRFRIAHGDAGLVATQAQPMLTLFATPAARGFQALPRSRQASSCYFFIPVWYPSATGGSNTADFASTAGIAATVITIKFAFPKSETKERHARGRSAERACISCKVMALPVGSVAGRMRPTLARYFDGGHCGSVKGWFPSLSSCARAGVTGALRIVSAA